MTSSPFLQSFLHPALLLIDISAQIRFIHRSVPVGETPQNFDYPPNHGNYDENKDRIDEKLLHREINCRPPIRYSNYKNSPQ